MFCIAPQINKSKWETQFQLTRIGQFSLGIYVVHKIIKDFLAIFINTILPHTHISLRIIVEFALLATISLYLVKNISKNDFFAKWLFGKQQMRNTEK